MKILLTTPLRAFTGEILKDGPESDLLLRNVLLAAVNQPREQSCTYAEMGSLFTLGVKLATTDEVDLTSSEVELLKTQMPRRFSALVVGQVGKILDGQPTGIVPKVEA
jgi:hypothetical protein